MEQAEVIELVRADGSVLKLERFDRRLARRKKPGIHGERGVLATDGERLQCHVCGEWFRFLGTHVPQAHGMTAKEYKREFGLKVQTGLLAPDLANKRRDTSHLRIYDEQNADFLREAGTDWHKAAGRSHAVSLQERNDEEWRENKARAIKAAQDKAAQMRRSGEMSPPDPAQTAKALEAARRRVQELAKDPEWASRRAQKAADRRPRAAREERTCVVCGNAFEIRATTKKLTCSPECSAENKRQTARANGVKNTGGYRKNRG